MAQNPFGNGSGSGPGVPRTSGKAPPYNALQPTAQNAGKAPPMTRELLTASRSQPTGPASGSDMNGEEIPQGGRILKADPPAQRMDQISTTAAGGPPQFRITRG
jgi:hypothetical protein